MMRTTRVWLVAVLTVATTLTAAAQEAPPANPPAATPPANARGDVATTNPTTGPSRNGANGHVTTQPGGGLMLNFKDASIDSVLDELSAVAGFVVVKVDKPEGRVSLVSKQPVSSSDAVSLLNTVLNNAGYAAIQQGRILKIVKRDAAKRANIPVRIGADPSKIEATDELITQVIPLAHTDAVQLKTDLAPLIGSEDFTANASSNALVVTDTAANVRRIVEIVSALDARLVDAADVKVVQLKYATASNAAKLINDLFGAQSQQRGQEQSRFPFFGGGFTGGGFTGGADRGREGRSGSTSQREQVRTNASSDDRTNTVVVTGPKETLAIVENVLKQLDSNPASEETVFIYRLRNAQSVNVESVVNMLFNGTTGASGGRQQQQGGQGLRGSSSGYGSSGSSRLSSSGLGSSNSSSSRFGGSSSGLSSGSSSPFGSSSNSSRFGSTGSQPSGGSFASWLSGMSQTSVQSAADLAGQVTIIADQDTNSLLVRTSPKNYERVKLILEDLDRAVPQVLIKVLIAEVTHDRSFDVGAQFSVLNLRAGGRGQSGGTNFGIGNLTSGMVVQMVETDVTATIRALETAGKLDVLSRPYILASDNQLANITVGQRVPLPGRTQVTDTGVTNASVEYTDVGILLDVIPHINPDGLVILDVAPEISALSDRTVDISNDFSAPVLDRRSAQSRIAVQNGQTVVIGGLMQDKKTQTVNKVPILGDIPLIGALFRRNQDTKTKTELLIFLTPHVAARPDVLKGMGSDEVDGTKLVPQAVEPGAFDEHIRGLERGATTLPATTQRSEER